MNGEELDPGSTWTSKDITGVRWRESVELVAVFDFEGTHRKDPSIPPCRLQSVDM